MIDTLPDKPSALIRLAISDLEKCAKSLDYHISMKHWHVPISSGTCLVCLAGSVMAQSLGCDARMPFYPSSFCQSLEDKFDALNYFRRGRIADGLGMLGHSVPNGINSYCESINAIEDYRSDPEAFKSQLLALADVLEAAKL